MAFSYENVEFPILGPSPHFFKEVGPYRRRVPPAWRHGTSATEFRKVGVFAVVVVV